MLLIRVNDPDDYALIDEITNEFMNEFGDGTNIKFQKKYESLKSKDSVIEILNAIFSTTIAIMMFLCFFSLTASMSANLYD